MEAAERVGAEGKRKRGGLVLFLLGVAIGVAGTIFLPGVLADYLPSVSGGGGVELRGRVAAKQLEGERLLLTVDSRDGALLATFTQRVSEIDLLVDNGDSVVIGLREMAPFAEDPELREVRKGFETEEEAVGAAPSGAVEQPPAGAIEEEGAAEQPAEPGIAPAGDTASQVPPGL